jgi:E3 ubiquitin-protein ligase DOA10
MTDNTCRICFESGVLFDLECSCASDLRFVHLKCADRWFSDNMLITLTGKLKNPTLTVTYKVNCEICNKEISYKVCREIYKLYDPNVINFKNKTT